MSLTGKKIKFSLGGKNWLKSGNVLIERKFIIKFFSDVLGQNKMGVPGFDRVIQV